MKSCNCPNCNAPIKINESANFALCEHCGTVIDTSDFRVVHVIEKRTVNKADEIRAETEKKRSDIDNTARILRWILIVFWIISAIGLWYISLFVTDGTKSSILLMLSFLVTCMGFGLFDNPKN